MNTDTMLNVAMSALFFAPLLIGLVFFLFVGALVAFEGLVSFAGKFANEGKVPAAQAAGAQMGQIASELQDSIKVEVEEAEAAKGQDKAQNG